MTLTWTHGGLCVVGLIGGFLLGSAGVDRLEIDLKNMKFLATNNAVAVGSLMLENEALRTPSEP